MKLSYLVDDEAAFDIEIKWFGRECLSQDHQIWTAIKDCANHFHYNHVMYENPDFEWPAEIALFMDGKEIGREKVTLEFEPVFEIV